jgi:hypothetical protein
MLNVKALWNGRMPASVWPQLKRSGKVIWRSLSTRTFLLLVAAPFVAWALMLMWVRVQYADDVVLHAVAAGPGVMLLVWAVLVSAWFGLTLGVAAYRHSLAIGLAFVVLVVLGLTTMPPRAARRVHGRASTSISIHPNGAR